MSLEKLKEPINLADIAERVYKDLSLNSLVKHFTTYEIIVSIMELVENIDTINNSVAHERSEKKELVIAVLNKLAKGKDGVAGTEDDLISVEKMNSIKMLLESSLVGDFIEVVVKATKGNININKVIQSGCISGILRCLGK
jgi:hypothetical protein